MSLVNTARWSLFDDMDRELRRFLVPRTTQSAVSADWVPAVDIQEQSDGYLLLVDVPGVKPENIEVSMDKGVLTIKGERSRGDEEQSVINHRRERRSGGFERSFRLPESVDAQAISATGRDGVLEVVIPKAASEQPRRIEVTH